MASSGGLVISKNNYGAFEIKQSTSSTPGAGAPDLKTVMQSPMVEWIREHFILPFPIQSSK
jgi:hypothetical protein